MSHSLGLLLLLLALAITTLLGVGFGATRLGFLDLAGPDAWILLDIRAPRVCLAILVGGGVAAAGAALQGLFRNPLADPALIGVSGGAALFAALYIVLGADLLLAGVGLSASAFVGGLLASLVVLIVGIRTGTAAGLLLTGIAINAVTVAGVGLLSYLSRDADLRAVTFWIMGSLGGADWEGVWLALTIPVAVLLLLRRSQQLNVMTLGELDAASLGIAVGRLRLEVVVLAALITGVSVALCGIIAFVGLIVPHLVRLMLGSGYNQVLTGSVLMGGTILVLTDLLGRTLVAPAEIPLGIITSVIGGPFFLYLVIRQARSVVL